MYWNKRDGTFEDVSLRAGPGILVKKSARGAAFADLFNTGQTDIVINNMNDRPTLLRNVSPNLNHSLLVQLVGTQSNRSGIGARVAVHVGKLRLVDEVRSGGSFSSQNDLRLHFGLGSATKVDLVEVQWPSGHKEALKYISADQWIVIKEEAGLVRALKFSAPPAFTSQDR